MTGPPLLVLFDIDGTLLATGGAGRRALQRAGSALYGDRFTVEGVDPSGKLDPEIFAELAGRHPELDLAAQWDRFHAAYLAAMRGETGSLRALPGAREAVAATLAVDGAHAGVLTGNYRVVAELKLRATGFDDLLDRVPSVLACGEDAPTRPDLVPLAVRRFHEGGGRGTPRVLLVGDTPRDVAAGRAHGAPVLGVASGRWSRSDLIAAGASAAVDGLYDAQPLLDLMDALREGRA